MPKIKIRKLLDDLGIITFRDVVGYEGKYGVTTCGKVWSYRSKKFLKPFVNTNGYPIVELQVNKHRKKFLVHRLVALTYIPNLENKKEVNHINGITMDSRLSNLEWVTPSENCQHAYDTGARVVTERQRASSSINGKVHCSKPVVQLDRDTGRIVAEYNSIADASNTTGLFKSNIGAACKGKIKTLGGFKWKYKSDLEEGLQC